ncbi:MAG TPA: carboxypeptidase regulatory-like domain-containing protein [Gemmatimonadaceae bacterium]|nr:carboxypeptidase regulatory-like domain-containing protein [Gemmatimonadaceae bacterium]
MAHLDEGTIHAWLDDALSPEEAARVEAHVAGCAECSAAVAEARGLMAAASRIVGALDRVPGGVIPTSPPAPVRADDAPRQGGRERRVRWTGWPLRAAAALLLMAGGVAVVWRDGRVQHEVRFAPVADQAADAAGGAASGAEQSTAAAPSAAAPAAPAAAPTTASAPAAEQAPARGERGRSPAAAPPLAQRLEAAPQVAPRAAPQAAEPTTQASEAPAIAALRAAPPPAAAPRVAPPAGREASGSAAGVRPEPSADPDMSRLYGKTSVASAESVRRSAERSAKATEDRAAMAREAAAGEVRGVVRLADGRPLAGAQVSVQGTQVAASTERDGHFVLSDVPAGRRELRVRAIGFGPTAVAVVVRPDTAAELEIALAPSTLAFSEVVVTGAATPLVEGCYVLVPALSGAGAPAGAAPDTLELLDEPLDDAADWSRARLMPGDSAARWRQEADGPLLVTWSGGRARLELRGTAGDAVRAGRWMPAGARTAWREVRAQRVECGRE